MVRIRKAAELTIGVLYAAGAAHQTLYVLRSSAEFYGDMAHQAWLAPAATFIEEFLVPNTVTVTILVATFEAALAIAILTRGPMVRPALIAGGVFSIIGALTGSPAETVGYGVLAAIHFWLAAARKPSDPGADQAA